MVAAIQIDGYREFQRQVKRAADKDLPKRIGQAHKDVGTYVISLLPGGDPAAVGAGGGASVRPSATKREVLLRVGGKHRADRAAERGVDPRRVQWGRREVRPFRSGRPHIIGTVERHEGKIREFMLQAVTEAMSPPFKT